MRNKILLLSMAVFMIATAMQAQIRYYSVLLTGFNESPPNPSQGVGYGQVTVNITAKTMRVYFGFTGLTGGTTFCHIHAATAAPSTGTAGVATQTPSFTGFPSGAQQGVYDHTFDMTDAASYNAAYVTANGGTATTAFTALQAALVASKAYLNVHTSTFTGGEIRGFMRSCTPTQSSQDSTICPSDLPFTWDGLTYTGSGTQTRIIPNGNSQGCDSAVIYTVTVATIGLDSLTSSAPNVCTNGTVTLTAHGVTGKNPTVDWWFNQANGTPVSVGSGTSVTVNSGPRTYHAMVMDDCGGMIEDSITIASTLTATWTTTNADCYGASNGKIDNIAVSGGTGPYMVSTKMNTGFANTTTLGNLKAASYRIFMQDNAGCTGFSNIIAITQPAMIGTNYTKTDALCYGTASGSINNIGSTGGTAPYKYSLVVGGTYSAVSSFTNLKPSTYRVFSKDAKNCPAFSDKISIGQQPAITFSFTKTDAGCIGTSNGSITVNATGGTGALTYRNGPGGTVQSSGTFNGLKAGNYRIYISDANSCSVFTTLINIANTACGSFARVSPSANETLNSGLSVYPNPAKGQFKLQLNGKHAGVASITITTQSGIAVASRQVTLSASQNVIAFDASRLAPGTYFAKVITAQGIEVTKVVVE